MIPTLWLFFIGTTSLLSVAAAGGYGLWVLQQPDLPSTAMRIPNLVQKCANLYLNRLYWFLGKVVLIGAISLLFTTSWLVAPALVFGAVCSATAGWLGMQIGVRANSRTTRALFSDPKRGIEKAFLIAFRGGAVMGSSGIGLSLLGLLTFWLIIRDVNVLLFFGLGATFFAFFAKIGGGIYTKAADIAADLVGKVAANLPEDDRRNLAIIADFVGDNVGDIAGMAADMIDSFLAALLAAMLAAWQELSIIYVILPMIIAAIGIIAAQIGIFLTRFHNQEDATKVLTRATLYSNGLFMVLTGVSILLLKLNISLYLYPVIGSVVLIIAALNGEKYTGPNSRSVAEIADASKDGPAFTVITGREKAGYSTIPTMLGITVAFLACALTASLAGDKIVYATALSAVGMLAASTITISADAFGPISDNAAGIAEANRLDSGTRDRADELDSAGNTLKGTTKGVAIGAAGLSILALIGTFLKGAKIEVIPTSELPILISGLFIGVMAPVVFSSTIYGAVRRIAQQLTEEVKKYLKEIGVLNEDGTPVEVLSSESEAEVPDEAYERCVQIASDGAMNFLKQPGILGVGSTLLVAFLLGKFGLLGFVLGCVSNSVLIAVFSANVGAMWDNAKKLSSRSDFATQYPPATLAAIRIATIIGDTIGDPEKDSLGPSLNTWLALIMYISNLIAPFLDRFWIGALLTRLLHIIGF